MMPDWLPVKLIASPPSSTDRDGEQRHGNALARREQHVELAALRVRRHLLGHREQLVGGVAHRRYHDDHVVTLPPRSHDAVGDVPKLLHVGDTAAAIFLHNGGHV